MTSNRVVEILVGVAVIAYCTFAVYTGQLFGRTRACDRRQEPWKFWTVIVVALGCAVALLSGFATWRSVSSS